MCGIIYKATNLVNGKVYIGQTEQTLNERMKEHYRHSKREKYNHIVFYRAIKKYGKENFKWEIIDNASNEDELNNKEIYWIDLYKSYIHRKDSNGYNMTLGGDGMRGYKPTEELKEKQSLFMKKYYKEHKHPMLGTKMKDSTKRKIGMANSGRIKNNETRLKLSKSLSGKHNPMYGRRHSEKTKNKMSEAKKGIGKIPIVQFTKNGEFVMEFESALDGANFTGCLPTAITTCCKGKRKTANGYVWMYKSDYENGKRVNTEIVNNKQNSCVGVVKLSKSGEFVDLYKSVKDGANSVNGDRGTITKCCQGKIKSAYGFIWKYENDYNALQAQ